MAACTVSPTGKQNSFASTAYASYCLAEKGDAQPRTLSAAFLNPLDKEKDLLVAAIGKLEELRDNFAKVYGEDGEHRSFNVDNGQGSLADVCGFIAE